ncbi:MAG: protein-glutamate O-methyltransferase CheR [Actinomycetota bacterium]|nr:protein-glutamate O-methyltransferase CheR [Actinomycetota bacterium]
MSYDSSHRSSQAGDQAGTEQRMIICELKDRDFQCISSFVYERYRINLHAGKKMLVQHRLNKRLRELGISDFRTYWEYLQEYGEEVVAMVDCLTTNHTKFFREPDHFDCLRKRVFPLLREREEGGIRIWSAGCSSGEEAYSLAIVLCEAIEDVENRDALILATDISQRMLERARGGVYSKSSIADIPPDLRMKYFDPVDVERNGELMFKVSRNLCDMVRFRTLNLAGQWPMKRKFDVILCRNVMIYFDHDTQKELVDRFWNILKHGGVFIVGHCESLMGKMGKFKYQEPTVYVKRD